jgi:hypothetical protein
MKNLFTNKIMFIMRVPSGQNRQLETDETSMKNLFTNKIMFIMRVPSGQNRQLETDETSMKNLITNFRRSEGLLRRMPSAKKINIMRVPSDQKEKS